MSSTVPINSDGWTLTTFFAGEELGRCYELKFPTHGTSHVVTENQLLDFFGTKGMLMNPRKEGSVIDRLHGPGAEKALTEAIASGAVFSESSR